MKTNKLIFVVAVISLFISSCLKDTCNASLGNTFNEITLDSTTLDGTNALVLYLGVDALDALPDAYFKEGVAMDSITFADAGIYDFTLPTFSISLANSVVPDLNQTKEIKLKYTFLDRSAYIDCQHPGSMDFYHLTLEMTVINIDDTHFEIEEFDWSEVFAAGHL